jgi:trimeric autotransporter adhesin
LLRRLVEETSMSDAGFGWFGRARKTSSTEPRRRRRHLGIMALEPRIMYDGAAAATAAAAHHHHHDSGPVDPQTGGAVGATGVSAPHQSGGDGHWHPATPSSEPMPQIATFVRNPTEIVFIDSQIPNYQALVTGANPGVEVVVLDPNSDGVAQIANFLSRHPDPNLTSIDIVAHGAEGELLLGSTNLTDGNLSGDSAALARIGAALKPGGGIMLYGCNVASGADGMQFIADLSKDAGGADVVAATHDIGMTADGPNWTLDASTGALVAGSPFTADAMANFTGQLGGEVQVNTTGGVSSVFGDTSAEVAALPNGDYVVSWYTGSGVRARLFNDSGTALGNDYAIPNIGSIYGMSIAALPVNAGNNLPDGGYIVVYANGSGVYGEIFDVTAAGAVTQVGGAFQIGTGGADYSTSVAVAANGSFMVTWDSAFSAIDARLYNASDVAAGAAFGVDPFQFNAYTTYLSEPTVAALSNGSFVIAYGGRVDQNNDNQVFAEVYNSSGSLVSDNTVSSSSSSYLDTEVAGLSGGGFAMVWNDASNNVVAQVFNNGGGSVSGQISVASESDGAIQPAVVAYTDGGFLVEWNGYNGGGYGSAIGAQRFSASGSTIGTAFQLDVPAEPASSTGGGSFQSPLAVLINNQVVVAFTDNTAGSGATVFADQFAMHSAPSGTDVTKTITENQSYTLAATDFGFSDPIDGDSFQDVEITSLPTSGTLTDNGATVTAAEIISLADINAGNLVYTPATGSSGTPDSHFTFQVQDSGPSNGPNVNLDPSANTFTFNVTPLVPVVTAGAFATFMGGGSAVTLDGDLTVTDPGSTTAASATISISSGFITGDTLNFTNVAADGNIAVSSNSNGQLVLTSAGHTAALLQWDAALDSITYSFSPTNGDSTGGGSHTSRTIDWVVNDGAASNTAVTSAVGLFHAPPTLTASGTAAFVQGGAAVTLDSGVTLTAPDSSGDFSSATIKVAGGVFSTDGDTLAAVTAGTGITASYAAASETLTLSGVDTLAHYQQVLDTVTFSSTGAVSGSRTIDWAVNDGVSSSATSTSTVTVHDRPTVSAGATATFVQGGSAVALDTSVALSAADSGGNISSATVSVAGGAFATDGDTLAAITTGTGITASYVAASETLTLSGVDTVAHYEQVLDSVTFSSTGATAGSRTVDWAVNDGTATSTTSTSTVTVHNLPTVSAGATATFTGGGSAQPLDSGLTVGDASSTTLASATVSIGNGFISGDTLNFTNVAADGNIAIATNSNGQLVLSSSGGSATLAQWNAALDSVTYSFIGTDPLSQTDGDPTAGGADTHRTVSYVVNDGVASSAAVTSTVDTVHVAPTVTAGATATYYGGGTPQPLDSTLLVIDNNSGGNLVGASVQVIGFLNGDTLNFTNTAHITGSYNAATGVLTLVGTDTVADYQAALRSVTYSFAGNGDPTVGGANTQRSIYWVVNDGNTVNGTNETLPNTTSATLDNDQPSLGLNQVVVETGLFPSRDPGGDGSGIPLGSIRTFAGSAIPAGSDAADGQLLAINQNSPLFSILGTSFGGNGTYNFGLPNLQGTLAAGYEDGSNPNFALGESYGSNSFTLTNQNLPHRWGGNGVAFDNDQPTQTVNYIINTGGTFPTAGGIYSLGTVVPFLGDFAPSGYMEADGQLLSIAQNAALFSILGTTYGGNGTTNFALPDLNGRTIVGAGADATKSILVGTTTGQDSTTLSLSNLPIPQGGSQPISNDQPSIALTYLVSTVGVYPSSSSQLAPDQQYLGEIIAFAGSGGGLSGMLNAGWAVANGQLLPINQNSSLFQVIGTTYGGDGTNNFALPDLVGRSVAGTGANTTVSLGEQFGSDTVSIPGGDRFLPTVATSTLDIVHGAPTVTASGTAAFVQGGSAITLDSGVILTAPDSNGNISSATVSVDGGAFATDGDTLAAITAGTGITASYAAATETLTLSGVDTVAHYEQVLDSVTFSSTGGTAGNRTIDWAVNDGVSSSATSASTATVHDMPIVSAGATATFTGGGSAQPLDTGLTVADGSSMTLASATVSIGAGFLSGDTLTINGTTSGTINDGANGTISYVFSGSSLTLSGTDTVADYQSALGSVKYSFTPANGDPTGGAANDTTRTISFVVNDGVASSTAATSTLDTVHVAPVVTPSGSIATFIGGGAAVPLDGALMVSDVDSNGNLAGATVSIGAGFLAGDTLTINGTASGAINDGANGTINYVFSGSSLTLSGTDTVADYQSALGSVKYSFTPANGDPTGGAANDTTRTISFVVNDGVASSTAVTSTLDAEHVAPVVTPSGSAATFIGGGAAVPLDSALMVSDVDSNGNLAGATVSIGTGFLSGDTLSFTNQNGITGSYDAAHGVLTLSGTATLANYRAALDSISFSFTAASLDPTAGGGDTTRSISWSVNDGVASSAAVTSTLDAVHAPPTVTAGNSLTFDANNLQPVILDSAIIVHDADKTTLAGAQVAITGGFVDTHDSLSFVSGNGITGNYDSATGVLTLSGVASVADYQAALASVTFSSSVQANGTRTVQWTVDDGNTQFNHSLVAQTALNVEGLSIRANVLPTAVLPPAASAFSAAFVPGSLTGPLVPPSGGFSDGFSGGHGFGYTVVHTDVALNTASDATVQIDLALATLEAPLGGDLTFVTARLANGDPLPDWLKFDPNTGSFAGLPPQGMFASLAPDQSPDSNIVTGTLPPNLDLGNDGATVAAEPETFAVEVLARDSRGDIAATIFTIDLRPHAGKQGWNMDRSLQPFGFERHTVTSTSLHHLAANEAVHDAARPFEMLASNVSPIHHDDAGSAAGNEAVPSGRAGLTEQMAAIGWRSMHAQRNALLASLQGR